jgi:hypothetical protein
MIDVKYLVAYWQREGHNATAIHAKLVIPIREKAQASSSVTDWLRPLRFGEDIFTPGIHSGKQSDGLVDFKILMNPAVFPFCGVQILASTLKIQRSTIWGNLEKALFVVKHSRWVSHRLDDVTKSAWVTTDESVGKDPRQARRQDWRCILTGDELWFFCATDSERMWLPE